MVTFQDTNLQYGVTGVHFFFFIYDKRHGYTNLYNFLYFYSIEHLTDGHKSHLCRELREGSRSISLLSAFAVASCGSIPPWTDGP
jgi:hypothetical protein